MYCCLRRSYITMIEVLLVMAILAITAGAVSINIRKAVREQSFNAEVSRVVAQLRLAQDLMLILKTDCILSFTQAEEEGIDYQILMERSLSDHWLKEIQKPHAKLNAIHWVEFKDDLPHPHEEGQLAVKFISGGTVMSKGLLRLSTSSRDDEFGALTRYVCLSGYPKAIVVSKDRDDSLFCFDSGNEEYEKNMTQYTVEEIASVLEYERPSEKK
jgi:type II secretory pathway pseudopilin PulG